MSRNGNGDGDGADGVDTNAQWVAHLKAIVADVQRGWNVVLLERLREEDELLPPDMPLIAAWAAGRQLAVMLAAWTCLPGGSLTGMGMAAEVVAQVASALAEGLDDWACELDVRPANDAEAASYAENGYTDLDDDEEDDGA